MEIPKNHTKNDKKVIKRTLKFFIEFCLVFGAIAVIFFALKVFDRYQAFTKNSIIKPGASYPQESDFSTIVFGKDDNVEVLAATDEDEPVYQSENYKTSIVTFGGNAAVPTDENLGLKINDVRSELLTTRNQQEIKLYVSWKTNKPAVSELKYGKNIDQGGKTVKEDKFSYVHSTIISPLDAASAYTYRIKGKDKWGNEVNSQQFAFYTGAPNVSLLDLLLGAFKDVFGWAMGK